MPNYYESAGKIFTRTKPMEHNGNTNTKANANDNSNANANRNGLLPPGQGVMIGGYFLRRRNVYRKKPDGQPNNGRQSAGQLSDSPWVTLPGGSQEGKRKDCKKDGAKNKNRPRQESKGCRSSTRKKPKFCSLEEVYTKALVIPREVIKPYQDGGTERVAEKPENTFHKPEIATSGDEERKPLLNLDLNVAPPEEQERRPPLNVDLNVAPTEEPERMAVLSLYLDVVPPEEPESPSTEPPLNIELNLDPKSPKSM